MKQTWLDIQAQVKGICELPLQDIAGSAKGGNKEYRWNSLLARAGRPGIIA
jgi:hypothetical protein